MLGTSIDSGIYRISRINRHTEIGFEYFGGTYRFCISGRFGNEDKEYALIWDTLQSVICRKDGSKPDRKTINNFLNYAGEYKALVREDTNEIQKDIWDFLRELDKLFKS